MKVMSFKFLFLVSIIKFLNIGCYSQPSKNVNNDAINKHVDTVSMNNFTQKVDSIPSCADILQMPDDDDDSTHMYYKKTICFNKNLIFLTKDCIFSVYIQNRKNCDLIFKDSIKCPIGSTSYREGSTIELRDMDGDKQNEVLIRIDKVIGGVYYIIYRLENPDSKIVLKKIKRIDEVVNPEYDEKTGLIRSYLEDRYVQRTEYFKLSKDNTLTFVRGEELSDDGKKSYTTKKGW